MRTRFLNTSHGRNILGEHRYFKHPYKTAATITKDPTDWRIRNLMKSHIFACHFLYSISNTDVATMAAAKTGLKTDNMAKIIYRGVNFSKGNTIYFLYNTRCFLKRSASFMKNFFFLSFAMKLLLVTECSTTAFFSKTILPPLSSTEKARSLSTLFAWRSLSSHRTFFIRDAL